MYNEDDGKVVSIFKKMRGSTHAQRNIGGTAPTQRYVEPRRGDYNSEIYIPADKEATLELHARIERVKASIERINALMVELKGVNYDDERK